MIDAPEKSMTDLSNEACSERLRTALDLADSGIQMKLSQLRRVHPDESDEEIRYRLDEWLSSPTKAKHGDAPGRLVDPATILES